MPKGGPGKNKQDNPSKYEKGQKKLRKKVEKGYGGAAMKSTLSKIKKRERKMKNY